MQKSDDSNRCVDNHLPYDVVTMVDDLLKKAEEVGATDVHFEPGGEGMGVRYRLDGVLREVERIPKSFSDNVITRLKVMGGLLTYRNDVPQEGRIQETKNSDKSVIEKRLSIFPTIFGQRAVVRIFYEKHELNDIKVLGFSDFLSENLIKIAGLNQGVLLLTGPAGSGKSTTLAALLRYINRENPGKSIVALEDPVERRIEGVTQVQISPHGEMTFPVALRSLLRQDPQVLMIGEIRDAETARMVIEAGLTGHLLMSTMHSGTPSGALLRLLEMGIEPYQITSSITAIVNQRLARRLCGHCRRYDADTKSYVAVGCERCMETGYKGRVLLAEMVQMDGQLRQAILEKADMERLEGILRERGHMNIRQDSMRLINKGVTSWEEVNKVV